VQQYNRPELLQSNIASEQRCMRMMGELSYRGVKLVHTPGHENPLADFLSRMNQDQNCPILQKMQHQLQETQPAGISRTEHSHAIMHNPVQRQSAADADNRSVNLVTSGADHQSNSDRSVCSVNFSKSNKAAADTSLPHEAATACQHFNALPFCHTENSIQRKSTFPGKRPSRTSSSGIP